MQTIGQRLTPSGRASRLLVLTGHSGNDAGVHNDSTVALNHHYHIRLIMDVRRSRIVSSKNNKPKIVPKYTIELQQFVLHKCKIV